MTEFEYNGSCTSPSRAASDKISDPEEPEPDGEEEGDLTANGELRQRKKARTRQNFSWRQVSVLEQVFEIDPVPSPALRSELATKLNLSPRCVQVWFQNRRQKWKAVFHASGQKAPQLKHVQRRQVQDVDALIQNLSGSGGTFPLRPDVSAAPTSDELGLMRPQIATGLPMHHAGMPTAAVVSASGEPMGLMAQLAQWGHSTHLTREPDARTLAGMPSYVALQAQQLSGPAGAQTAYPHHAQPAPAQLVAGSDGWPCAVAQSHYAGAAMLQMGQRAGPGFFGFGAPCAFPAAEASAPGFAYAQPPAEMYAAAAAPGAEQPSMPSLLPGVTAAMLMRPHPQMQPMGMLHQGGCFAPMLPYPSNYSPPAEAPCQAYPIPAGAARLATADALTQLAGQPPVAAGAPLRYY